MQQNYQFTARKKNGLWQLILTYRDSQGRRRQKAKQGYRRRSDALAQSEKDKLLARIHPDVKDVKMEDITLEHFLEVYREDHKDSLTYNTLKNYDIALSRVPQLLKRKMVDITYADVLHAVNAIYVMKPSSINLTVQKLKALFSYASDVYHLFPTSPIARLPAVKDRRDGRVKALTPEERDELLSALKKDGPLWHAMASVAAFAGLRFGEICGLTTADIDFFPTPVIHVRHQWGLISAGKYAFKSPKSSNGFRDIPMPPVMVSILRSYLSSRHIVDISARIFPQNESSYLNARIKKHNPSCSVHQLRHTYATTLLANGVDVKTVSALMGDKVETILKTYVHYTDEMRKNATENVKKIFG